MAASDEGREAGNGTVEKNKGSTRAVTAVEASD